MMDRKHGWIASFKPLYIGFTLAVLLIFAAYRIVMKYHLPSWAMTEILLGLAFFQSIIQMIFFLQLGLESKPRWNLITFLGTLFVILIIVIGSIWIMQNLKYNLMP